MFRDMSTWEVIYSISFTVLFTFPMMVLTEKIESIGRLRIKRNSALEFLNWCLLMSVLISGNYLIFDGIYEKYILITYAILFIVSIAILASYSTTTPKRTEDNLDNKKRFWGISLRMTVVLALILVISSSIVIPNAIMKSSDVLSYHKQFFIELAESKNKMSVIKDQTNLQTRISATIIPNIQQILKGETTIVYILPWKIKLAVITDTKTNQRTWKFEYVSDNTKWRLNSVEM